MTAKVTIDVADKTTKRISDLEPGDAFKFSGCYYLTMVHGNKKVFARLTETWNKEPAFAMATFVNHYQEVEIVNADINIRRK